MVFCHIQKLMYFYIISGILSGMIEAQKQLQSGSSDVTFDYREEVRDSFDALVSSLYNFSRNKHMRLEIGMFTLFSSKLKLFQA